LVNLGPLPRLRALYLSLNRVAELQELEKLRSLKQVLVIHLSQNPVARKPLYRAHVICAVQTVRAIDGREVTEEERERVEQTLQTADPQKQNAVYMFNEPPQTGVQLSYVNPPTNVMAGADSQRQTLSTVTPGLNTQDLSHHGRRASGFDVEGPKKFNSNRAHSAPRHGSVDYKNIMNGSGSGR
ncbi:unnamed protein product, partial [Polarella glacialis]